MEYVVGITLALLFCGAVAGLGMDRERVFYPAVVMAVASYYLAFAVVDGRNGVMLSEVAIAAVFIAGAVAGFKYSAWIAVVALGGSRPACTTGRSTCRWRCSGWVGRCCWSGRGLWRGKSARDWWSSRPALWQGCSGRSTRSTCKLVLGNEYNSVLWLRFPL